MKKITAEEICDFMKKNTMIELDEFIRENDEKILAIKKQLYAAQEKRKAAYIAKYKNKTGIDIGDIIHSSKGKGKVIDFKLEFTDVYPIVQMYKIAGDLGNRILSIRGEITQIEKA